jgi:restriction endonuclease S subunit
MDYTVIPAEINIKDFIDNDFSFSPSRYKKIDCPNPNTKKLGELLDRQLKITDKGIEIGSNNYITISPYKFIRTKGIQFDSFLPYFRTDSVVPILPSSFTDYKLSEGDVLISKDSNIGEVAILDKDYPNYMISGGIYRLPLSTYKYYVFGFLKHEFFKKQLDFLTSRGATIRHAKTLFLDCRIPFPNQENKDDVIKYVELLVASICLKEKSIRQKDISIRDLIYN